MSVKSRLIISISIIILASLAIYLLQQQSPAKQSFRLNFKAVVAGQALAFNQAQYPNPGGHGNFKIRDFQFYISNLKLISETSSYQLADSYHLARFDNELNNYSIELKEIPADNYKQVQFSIGIDKAANNEIVIKGDLDPNNRMAWNWEVGHKFILFEGTLITEQALKPLVYHVGFDENYKTLEFPITLSKQNKQSTDINFNVDLMRIFTGTNKIDMETLSSIKFDRGEARMLANNYQHMISLSKPK